MAYGDDLPPDKLFDDLEHTEFMFRMGDLIDEWFRTLSRHSHPERWTSTASRQADMRRADDRLEETALEFALYLKALRIHGEAGCASRRHLRPLPGERKDAS